MSALKPTRRHDDTRGGTISIRMRVQRDLHARLDHLRRRYPIPPKINEQARRCLELGVEAEELGGNEPMLDARISEKVNAQIEQVEKRLKETLLEALKEYNIRPKKGRGGTSSK